MSTLSTLSPELITQFQQQGYILYHHQLFSAEKFAQMKAIFEEQLAQKGAKLSDELDMPHLRDERLLAFLLSDEIVSIPKNNMRPDIHHALIYMQHHFREPLTLEEVARQAALSTNYFSACFHKAVGTSFQQYLQFLRLRFARSLLRISSLPVTTICFSSGFTSLAHFERTFKQQFGLSPRAYQQHCLHSDGDASNVLHYCSVTA